jgi:PPOX class probable F420-dependent enzyme
METDTVSVTTVGLPGTGERHAGGWPAWVAAVAGIAMSAAGVWSLAWPRSFADFVDFPYHEHFLHDIGAFQLGIGSALLIACLWSDGLATALAGFLVADTAHTVNHIVDRHLGGATWQTSLLAIAAVATAAALTARLRQLGGVTGRVAIATGPALAPYVRQKTILLTTYRKDGSPGSSPVSIAVDGDRAYLRSYHNALKTRRLLRNPAAQTAPSTARGRPTGPPLPVRLRLLEDPAGNRHAARLLTAKYPVLHGLLVPLAHKVVMRRRTGGTVHFELSPREDANGHAHG